MGEKLVKVKLMPQRIELLAPKGSTLLEFLLSQGIPIGNACGGMGLCASCKVIVLRNERGLSTPKDKELDLKDRNNLQSNVRISCQCKINDDIEITTGYW